MVRRAQDRGEPWITAAMGMAMPMLKKIAGNAARGFHGDIADFDSEIFWGFLHALNTVDHRAPNLEAGLIVRAHLEGEGQASLAEACGVSPYLLRQQLVRAQDRLVRFLARSVPRPVA